jgi:hypothetical protein
VLVQLRVHDSQVACEQGRAAPPLHAVEVTAVCIVGVIAHMWSRSGV